MNILKIIRKGVKLMKALAGAEVNIINVFMINVFIENEK
jgi:hypothetical protein